MSAPAATRPTFRHPAMTPNQAGLLVAMIDERFAVGTPKHDHWRTAYFAVDSHTKFKACLDRLKTIPKLARTVPVPAVATGEGLYVNPEIGTMYRLRYSEQSRTMIVSIYSQAARARRLLADGTKVTKGTWRRLNADNSRRMLQASDPQILAAWLLSDEDKVEYLTGICNFCYRGLVQPESVTRNYGEDCAEKHHLPYNRANNR